MNDVEKPIHVVLIGNPNTGKTSLLNALTGMSLHVGNWPGKTVEKKEGQFYFNDRLINIVDLPGTYSIAPYSEEEKVSHDYLMSTDPDVIIQTIDVNALERNLLMTMELLALGKKIVLAFNFNKEAKRRGIAVDIPGIQKVLQVPVVPIEANKGENTDELLKTVLAVAQGEFGVPDYLPLLLKEDYQIHHDDSVAFFKEKLAPFYSTEKTNRRTEKIDGVLLNKYTAFPIFLMVILLMFEATFTLSGPLVNVIHDFFGYLGKLVSLIKMPSLLNSLISEGFIGGVGSVLAFAPLIFILFLLIALLEDSGYLGRTVVLVDPLFQKLGVSGRTFIPMILGFGCNVPAIMATRTIKDRRERMIAIFTNSFMSCGARLPVYLLFTGVFFSKKAGLVVIMLYLFGILISFGASFVLSRLIRSQGQQALIIELPPYRMPTIANVVKHAWYHTKEFIKKAGTIIIASVLVIWTLASLPAGVVYGSEASLLGKMGHFISPFFKPLGFGDWTFAVALIFGVVAKEVIIGTLGTLYGVGATTLAQALPKFITPLGALSFLFFVSLYIPCMATIATIRQESGGWKYAVLQPVFTISIAWLVAFGVYHLGLMLGFH